jgi:hypothetical protein
VGVASPLGYDGGMNENPYESPTSVKSTAPQSTAPQTSGGSRMDGPELFGALVRAIGLYFILTGILYVIHALFRLGEVARVQAFDGWASARGAVEYLAPGIIVFFFSDKIVRLAYRDERGQRSEDS